MADRELTNLTQETSDFADQIIESVKKLPLLKRTAVAAKLLDFS
jgi:hypothetical protein